MVGSTDAHTALAAVEEDNFFGKVTPGEPSPERLHAKFMHNPKLNLSIFDWEVCAAGYAAVWAEENTRASIWDAMQRKETYATTGSDVCDSSAAGIRKPTPKSQPRRSRLHERRTMVAI